MRSDGSSSCPIHGEATKSGCSRRGERLRASDGDMRTVGNDAMRKYYDFSKGKRGAVIPTPPGKTRITIRIDTDVLDWFREQVDAAGGGSYQTMMNQALREYAERKSEGLEETLRRVLVEMLPAPKPRKKAARRRSA
jgi:uncharacterized protein (DUF4415 family)